ncbi:MAG TPA: N-6 DNA methylase [Candidatus Sulfotelmatobacter sp.]|nr:N-6 DNA methylase [Candidatus Sulfotelmatobacter sp.]
MATSIPVNERLTAKQVKEGGVHYTPPELAQFLASHVAAHLPDEQSQPRLLDPACGDGELLEALAVQMPAQLRSRSTFFGMESDPIAIQHATKRLRSLPDVRFELIETDFLSWTTDFQQPQMFAPDAWHQPFDAVISNPPYVRTQVMGGGNAQKLATQFGITGRVDLYHAFALAMTLVLREGGVLGLLCSNRFLSVQSGATLRKVLLQDYALHDIFDLGDTKLFGAAVLPAIVIGTKAAPSKSECRFTRIYENRDLKNKATSFPTVLKAIDSGADGAIQVNDRVFLVERGRLAAPANLSEPWRVSSPEQDAWLANLKCRAPRTFADLVNIRVGVKTTADNVFIRDDWSELPKQMQPEPEVLFPLVSNWAAEQWWPLNTGRQVQILYTHTLKNGKRVPIDLEQFPRAANYLESQRAQLEGRKYVIEAGRRWYEIWVPQQPSEWPKPKAVFPDISPTPKFFLDETGSIVDGNCYWFTAQEREHLYLLLAIANSTFILKFYDMICGNKLYAGRRRFITQYVERFPVPDPDSAAAERVIAKMRALYSLAPHSEDAKTVISEVDSLVWDACSLVEKIAG